MTNKQTIEQKSCEDCISRERVCEFLAEFLNHEYSTQPECELINIMIEGIKHLPSVKQEPKTKWIPVSERLPGMNETVLVTDDGDAFFKEHGVGWIGQATTLAYMTEKGWEISDINYECQMNKITAWLPLPEPYKEREE